MPNKNIYIHKPCVDQCVWKCYHFLPVGGSTRLIHDIGAPLEYCSTGWCCVQY